MDNQEGEEWNFAYVMPQEKSEPTRLVVPTSLQMGWVESPPYFCAATETSRDIALRYCDSKIGSMPPHKFEHNVMGSSELKMLEDTDIARGLRYALEVYVDDFMAIILPTSRAQVEHVARAVMATIHDVFPASNINADNPISEKKLKKGEGTMSTKKLLLGFEFDGINKTLWLESEKRDVIVTTLHKWIRAGSRHRGIPFEEFESIMAKIRHAFTALPAAIGLLSGTNSMLQKHPEWIYLQEKKYSYRK